MIPIGDHFWNIRGSFKIAGLLDVGTQASLLRRHNGRFLLLDACDFDRDTVEQIDALTRGGEDLEAILHLHPFHTLHVESAHERYPDAALYGSRRHQDRLPDLPWADETMDQAAAHERFAEDLDFSVPEGVDFISANESVHFSSVLAYHRASRTIHSDDTFNYMPPSGLIRFTPLSDTVSFHPTLAKALERRAGAADDFRAWAAALMEDWSDAEHLCAAHTGPLLAETNDGATVFERMKAALDKVEDTLARHASRYG